MLSDAFAHALHVTIATLTPLKGTAAVPFAARSGDVKGTAVRKPVDLQGCPTSRTYSPH
jgi:hypothetical protein